jgi:1-acyl-sn-glycerol-3-phosphate acyltransferase
MRPLFHSLANHAARWLMMGLFGAVARVRVLRRENANHGGGFLLAANHISHFDPFIVSSVVPRKIDWMAMAEFFPYPVLGWFLRAVDAFPADRHRANRRTICAAIERLKNGRIVGIFPEAGIRDGTRSLLEGAPLRPGAATLAHIAQVPIVPAVIVGSDRFYAKKSWLPLRRTPIWIAFGNPIPHFPDLEKSAARSCIESELAGAFKILYAEVRETFSLTANDLPQPPKARMKKPAALVNHEDHEAHEEDFFRNNSFRLRDLRVLRGERKRNTVKRIAATTVDSLMCASMNFIQSRHRLHARSREEMEDYVAQCEKITAHNYYAANQDVDLANAIGNGSGRDRVNAAVSAIGDSRIAGATWRSPIETKFPANNIARADLFPCARGWSAPTVLMLHALMSATRVGYRRWAAHFNELGWNACFVHLPYHYSRVPRGYWNGELAITADLIRNAEGLRQGVIEIRQLMAALRVHGCREFGVLGTSYGGWIGALLAMVERDFRFVALMAPIVNIEHAIWQSPAAIFLRRELHQKKIEPSLVARHFHLSSPMHNEPMCDAGRVLFVAGDFDLIARPLDIESIHQKWRGSELLRVRQGHFGYRMLRETIERLKERAL